MMLGIFLLTFICPFVYGKHPTLPESLSLAEDFVVGRLALSDFVLKGSKLSCAAMTVYDSTCESSENLHQLYFHAIFDFQRPSSLSLFLNQVCRALSLCIKAPQFRIVLHYPHEHGPPAASALSQEYKLDYIRAAMFLEEQGISYLTWQGSFDTYSSQQARLVSLYGLGRDVRLEGTGDAFNVSRGTSEGMWIFQVDADEFPSFSSARGKRRSSASASMQDNEKVVLSQLLNRLSSQIDPGCDAVYGELVERLPLDGRLVNISLPDDESSFAVTSTSTRRWERGRGLGDMFPLACNVKASLEKAQVRKLVLYRASFRPSVGNHRLLCEGKEVEECLRMQNKRRDLKLLHPSVSRTPRRCVAKHFSPSSSAPLLSLISSPLVVDHYKFTWGVQAYLQQRVDTFRARGIPWHTESSAVLRHAAEHGGRICVTCPEVACKNVTD